MLPARNRKDYEDIPQAAREELEFIWLQRVEEAVAAALEPASPDRDARQPVPSVPADAAA